MRYGKVSETIWTDDKFSGLSDTSKLLFIYLLSCPRCNSVGIFFTGLGAVEDEFRHDRDEIRRSISELDDAGLARYESGWFCFNRYLKWNAPVSPNHARQIAATLNECVMQNAPVNAICSFLGSTYGILNSLKYKTNSGQIRTYWDEFKQTLDIESVSAYLGGPEAFQQCVRGSSCSLGSTPKALPKARTSTFITEAPDKDSPSTAEVLLKDWATRNRNIQETETYKTRNRQETNLAGSCENKEPIEFTVICSDGKPRAMAQASVRLIAEKHPDWDLDILRNRIQALTMVDPDSRPEPDKMHIFLSEICSHFDGDHINLPQNRFSAQKGEFTLPTETNASEEAKERATG